MDLPPPEGGDGRRPSGRAHHLLLLTGTLVFLSVLSITLGVRLHEKRKIASLALPASLRFQAENARVVASGHPVGLVLIGDSRIAHWKPLPSTLAGDVLLRGVGGETTGQTAARFESDALALHAAAIVVVTGINDIVAASYLPQDGREATLRNIAGNMEAMAQAADVAGACVLIALITPPARPGLMRRIVWRETVLADVGVVNALMRKSSTLAGRLLDPGEVLEFEPGGYLATRQGIDALHFSMPAYRELNRLLAMRLATKAAASSCRRVN